MGMEMLKLKRKPKGKRVIIILQWQILVKFNQFTINNKGFLFSFIKYWFIFINLHYYK